MPFQCNGFGAFDIIQLFFTGEAVVTMLGQIIESPERIWSSKMAKLTADEVHSVAVQCRALQVGVVSLCFVLI